MSEKRIVQLPETRLRRMLADSFMRGQECERTSYELSRAEAEAHANRFVDEYLSAGHIVRAPSPSPREALEKTGRALAFAASVIKGGEPWTEQCEREIGGALRALTATEDQGGA